MEGNGKRLRGGKKAARPAATQTQQPAAQAALETPASPDGTASALQQAVDDGQPVASPSLEESRGVAGAEEDEDNHDDDDEQVERFYALLANIRAMRGLPPHNVAVASSSSCGGGGGDTGIDTAEDSTRKKRLRLSAADPPWRPAFRMEDFDEPAPTPTSNMVRKPTSGAAGHDDHGHGHGDSTGSEARPLAVAVVASSSSFDAAAARGGTVPTGARQQEQQRPTVRPSG